MTDSQFYVYRHVKKKRNVKSVKLKKVENLQRSIKQNYLWLRKGRNMAVLVMRPLKKFLMPTRKSQLFAKKLV